MCSNKRLSGQCVYGPAGSEKYSICVRNVCVLFGISHSLFGFKDKYVNICTLTSVKLCVFISENVCIDVCLIADSVHSA